MDKSVTMGLTATVYINTNDIFLPSGMRKPFRKMLERLSIIDSTLESGSRRFWSTTKEVASRLGGTGGVSQLCRGGKIATTLKGLDLESELPCVLAPINLI